VAKTPAYRLQVLFGMREKAKKAAEEVYAEKKRLVAVEQKKLEEMKQKLVDMIAARQAKKAEYAEKTRRGELTVSQITANDRHIDRLKSEEAAYQVQIDRQLERLREAERVAEEAMQEVVRCTMEFKALEKHKEKWLQQIKREAAIKEELQVEDIAQAQYFQKLLEEHGGG
jgi:hypothetical protein